MKTFPPGPRAAGAMLWLALVLAAGPGQGSELVGKITVDATAGTTTALMRLYRLDSSGRELASSVIVTRTSRSGEFAIKGIAEGLYLLEVEMDGQVAYRTPVTVAGPRTTRQIDIVRLERRPFVEITIFQATDEVKINVNGVQVMTWSLDGPKTRRVALKEGTNEVEVRVVNRGAFTSGARVLGGGQPEAWDCAVRLVGRGGRELAVLRGGESVTGRVRHGREFVLGTATLNAKSTGDVSVVESNTGIWRRDDAVRPVSVPSPSGKLRVPPAF